MRDLIIQSAMKWIDTPYHHHARVHGVGVDCAQLLVAVAIDVGLMREQEAFLVPNYPPEWHLHNKEEHLLHYLELLQCVETDTPVAGDIMCFQFGRGSSHLGILLNDTQFIHACLRSKKVVVNTMNDDWRKRWVHTYQFPEVKVNG